MKALYKQGRKFFGLTERPRPTPAPDEILLKVDSAAICHTDILIRGGAAPHGVDTFVPGHEFSGVVVERGTDIDYLSVGDRGVVQQIVGCNRCPACRLGRVTRCENFDELGVKSDGGFAEYCAVPARNFHRLPDAVSLEAGALTEPLANAISAVGRAHLEAGEKVVVVGPGAIGLLCLQVAQLSSPSLLVLVGRREDVRMATGRQVCPTARTVNVADPAQAASLRDEILGATGADVVIECSGSIGGFTLGLQSLGPGGRLCCEGSVGKDETIPFSPYLLQQNRSIAGISGWEPRDFQKAVSLISSRAIATGPLVTHRFPLDEWEQAFELATARKSESIRVLLKP
jgi:threonine dehydrogenase-like Zn-dependent dehydrogenase